MTERIAEEVFTAAENFLPDVTALVATLAQKQDSKAFPTPEKDLGK